MAVKSGLASINPSLRLAFRAGLVALLFFWVRSSHFSFGAVLLFTLIFALFYFRPLFNAGRFSISALFLYLLTFLVPSWSTLEIYLTLAWGGVFFALIGAKNFILLKRQGAYELVHLSLVFGTSALFFVGTIPQAVLFAALFFLFREFYFNVSGVYQSRLVLAAALLALLLTEVGWLLSFIPLMPLVAASLITLSVFLLHDTLIHHLKEAMTRELVLRNITIFVLMALVIVALPL